MPAFIFLVLVGLFAHSVFVPAGPIVKPEEPPPKIVVIDTAGQVVDTWRQNTKGEIVVEVPVVEEEIVEADPVEVTEEEAGEEASEDEEEGGESDDETSEETSEETPAEEEEEEEEEGAEEQEELPPEEEVSDPVEEEVIEEAFEAPPIVEDPVLVIEDETAPEPEVQNLVEALIDE